MRGIVIAVAVMAGCAAAGPRAPDGHAVVVHDVDGDTIEVSIRGHRESVRLLGIDTPETKHPTKPVECYGPEASARTAALLPPGTKISLERDAQARDVYGRLLAYVHKGDVFVNLALVDEGYARVLSIAPNTAFAATFSSAEANARADHKGLWGEC